MMRGLFTSERASKSLVARTLAFAILLSLAFVVTGTLPTLAQSDNQVELASPIDDVTSSRRTHKVKQVTYQEPLPLEEPVVKKLDAENASFGTKQQSAYDRYRQPGREHQGTPVRPAPLPHGFTNIYRNGVRNEGQEVAPPVPPSMQRGTYEVAPSGPAASDIQINESNGLINIVARDAYLRDVLALLSKQYNLNFVHGQIEDRISISLRQVSLEDALSSLLSVAGCTWSNNQGIIHIRTLSAQTRSNLSPAQAGLLVRVFPLDFVSAAEINQVIIGMLSPAGISYVLTTDPKDNRKTSETVVVEDTPSSLSRIEQYIRQIDIPPRQVLIEARVLEVKLRDNEKHGVNFEHIASIAGKPIKLGTLGVDPTGTSTLFAEIDMPDLKGFLDALQTTVDTTTLASPRIMALNGQEARLQVGQQLGFRVVTTTQTSTLEDVRFLDVGIVLAITPRIARDGRILLHVKPEVSSGQINPDTGLPEEETSEVETNVMLAHGKGMIIGGLIQERDNRTTSQTPRLGNVPIVGSLFRRKDNQKARTEVIFVLMPRIVDSEPNGNAFPTDPSVHADTHSLDHRDRLDANRGRTHLLDRNLNNYHRPNEWNAGHAERQRNQTINNDQTTSYGNEQGIMFDGYDQHPFNCRCQRCGISRSIQPQDNGAEYQYAARTEDSFRAKRYPPSYQQQFSHQQQATNYRRKQQEVYAPPVPVSQMPLPIRQTPHPLSPQMVEPVSYRFGDTDTP